MRFSKTCAIIIALNIVAWIIPQDVSAQRVSKSSHLFYHEINSNGDYVCFGDVWIPCLYPGSRRNLSNMEIKNNGEQIEAGPGENDLTAYQPVINDVDKNTKKVVLAPMEDKSIEYDRESVYKFNLAVDIPIVAVGTVWSAYALSKIYKKTSPTVEEIQALNKNNIPFFDRWAVYPYDKSLDKLSYYPFYGAIPLPLIFFLSAGKTYKDFFKLSFLYWETLSIMGVFGTSSTYYVNRYRPYTYTDGTPMDVRTNNVARNSFFSGHVEMVAAPTFLIATVYSDYYPESKIKWVFYGFAATITTATSYLRLKSGEHFPSDIILGAVVGTLAGILVPEYHKNKDSDLSILPYSNDMAKGIAFVYKF
jgi:membrane-associated phospholipid phosphatase